MAVFDDPALVFACDLPVGWCLDAESSLLRLVFRPWDRLEERVVVTVLPTGAPPTTPDDDWSNYARERFGLGDATQSIVLASGLALAANVVGSHGDAYQRVVRRGPFLDVVTDHVGGSETSPELAPVLLRIAAGARAPARPPEADGDTALEEAEAAAEALPAHADAASIVPALRRIESAAEERWLRSLVGRTDAGLDLKALQSLWAARAVLGRHHAFLLSLRSAHAVLMRAVPSKPPTEPYIAVDEELRSSLTALTKGMFGHVAWVLRQRQEAQPFAGLSDDEFGSDAFVSGLLAHLITEDVRAAYERGERVRPEAAYEAVLAQLGSMGAFAPGVIASGRPEELAEELRRLGRSLTAYLEAALGGDDRDAAAEAAEALTRVGERLFELAPPAADRGEPYRAVAAAYAATGLYDLAEVLVRAADRPSLEEALVKVDEAYEWLGRGAGEAVDEVNACHVDALAALQLGDSERARRAVDRGAAAAARLGDQREVEFFVWAGRVAELVEKTPGVVRSLPELQFARMVADGDRESALELLCQALERELATDPVGATTIERLVVAAGLLPDDAADALVAAVESLLDLKRLLVVRTRQLRLGADDSLLARRVAARIVERRIAAGELAAAVTAADRGRARSLLLDLQLRPGQTAHLQAVIDAGFNPGHGLEIERTIRERTPEGLQWLRPPRWAGLYGVRSLVWLRRLAAELVIWVNELTAPLGVGPLTPAELLAQVRAHGQPVLLLHPTEDRVALFVVTPEGDIHHAWSPVGTRDVLAQAEQLRHELGVWVSSRQRGLREWPAAGEGELGAYRASAAAAHESLVAPALEHLAGYSRLTIVPYRELGALPYALLEDGAGTQLLERFAVTTAPSIATLAVLKRRAAPAFDPRSAYVIGDPEAPDLPRLPGAAEEANSVCARLKAANPDLEIRHRAGRRATPASYLSEARGARLVHLACHAGVGTTAAASALYLAGDAAGDHTLDVAEIARVPLANALVFLAACRSGTGRATADGTVGLAREFLRAGAGAVVASYWKVSDEATRVLVEHFYDAFLGGRDDVATALRAAMQATRAELSAAAGGPEGGSAHPGGWGPFFVLGDGTLRDELRDAGPPDVDSAYRAT